jgi:hypothetical protein
MCQISTFTVNIKNKDTQWCNPQAWRKSLTDACLSKVRSSLTMHAHKLIPNKWIFNKMVSCFDIILFNRLWENSFSQSEIVNGCRVTPEASSLCATQLLYFANPYKPTFSIRLHLKLASTSACFSMTQNLYRADITNLQPF